MKIKYLGHSSFKIEDNGVSFVFDPHINIGYDYPSVSADLCLVSHNHYDHNNVGGVKNVKEVVVDTSLAYNGINVESFKSFHDEVSGAKRGVNFIHKVTTKDATYLHLGDFGESPDKYDFSSFVGVDFLFLPVGGTYTIDADGAKKIVDEIRPRFIVPMHYKTEKSTVDIASIDSFLRYFMTSKLIYLSNEVDLTDILAENLSFGKVLIFDMPDGQTF